MPNYGLEVFKGRRWPTQMRVSGINAPAETWAVDPSLPPLGSDPRFPTSDLIVIPRGRLIAVRPDMHTAAPYSDEAYLTIADGSTNKPIGYTESNVFRSWPQRIQVRPVVSKQEFIVLPYITTINDAYGALEPGDRITAYFGSVTSTSPNPMEKGRIVKWVPRKLYAVKGGSAGATQALPAAVYPAFKPRVIAAFDNAGALLYPGLADPTVSWNSGGYWQATFSGAGSANVQSVIYEFGQDVDQIAGEVVRIQRIDSSHLMHGWLQWVTDNYPAWDYPPMAIRVPVTDVGNVNDAGDADNETPTHLSGGHEFQLANRPVAFWKPIKVWIKGSFVNESGQTVTDGGGWLEMPLADVPYANWAMGKYHVIDPFTGRLTFSSNVTITQTGGTYQVKVAYSYETSYRDGRLWASGQMGLTDGSGGSGIVGMPAHLDVPGVAGELRVIIY